MGDGGAASVKIENTDQNVRENSYTNAMLTTATLAVLLDSSNILQ